MMEASAGLAAWFSRASVQATAAENDSAFSVTRYRGCCSEIATESLTHPYIHNFGLEGN
jgi:hypothetical protein